MPAAIRRLGERSQAARLPRSNRLGLLLGVATLAVCMSADLLLGSEAAALVGTYVAAPFVAALFGGPIAAAAVGAAAFAGALASPAWNMGSGGADHLVRLGVIGFGTGFAAAGAWVRERSGERSARLRLLDSVGAVADGSLPLAETLTRVTEVISPAFADICMVDAVHSGRATRIATRARGRADAERVEERMRRRPPTLPGWLVSVERPWRDIPRWWPRLRDEELRRMSHSDDDLEFLRSLGLRSSIVVPIRARDRNLGALTVLVAWSGRRYSADDLHFAQILASRIGLALDNAGLFSDLESVERRMDTVMSILDEAIVIHGAEGELVFANPAAARTLGYASVEEALDASPERLGDRILIRDERGRRVDVEALSGRRALSGEQAAPVTLRVTNRTEGVERWMRTKARPIRGTSGEILYSVTAIEDVTEVKRAEFAQRLLARTGELVAHSEDYRRTLDEVAALLVPEFADWCAISAPRADGTIETLAIAHHDPARAAQVEELRDRYPGHVDDEVGVAQVLRTGEAQLLSAAEEETLRAAARDAEHLQLLRALRLDSAIVVPMSAGGRVAAALTLVNDAGSRRFGEDDLELAAELARRAALAIEAARVAEERVRVADALQRELLPPSLPTMPGWEVATMYEPAGEINEVGGDFYEVFRVEGAWAVVLGDVAGKGAAAAALTAEARHTIRVAGALSGDPRRGLEVLDRNLRDRDDAALCSVALAILPEESEPAEVRVYLAGHPYPLLLRDGEAQAVGEPGPLLGVADAPSWSPVSIRIEPGDQLVLYTDGVIEARGSSGERFGTERLRAGLAGCASPELTVDRVRAELAGFGALARQDDAALVAIRRRGGGAEPVARRPDALAAP